VIIVTRAELVSAPAQFPLILRQWAPRHGWTAFQMTGCRCQGLPPALPPSHLSTTTPAVPVYRILLVAFLFPRVAPLISLHLQKLRKRLRDRATSIDESRPPPRPRVPRKHLPSCDRLYRTSPKRVQCRTRLLGVELARLQRMEGHLCGQFPTRQASRENKALSKYGRRRIVGRRGPRNGGGGW
jgi:hypothetical protein